MYKRFVEIISLLSLIALFVFFNQSSPSSIGPTGLLIVFLLIYVGSVGLIADFIYYGSRAIIYYPSKLRANKYARISFKQSYYYSSVISMAPVILLALNSIGSVDFYEIALTVTFVVLGCFFVAKR